MSRLAALLFLWLFLLPLPAHAQDTVIYYNSSYITAAEVSDLSAALTGQGATVTTSTSTSWPTSYSGKKLVVILLPSASFSSAQASALKSVVSSGGRVVVAGDWEGESCLSIICWETGFYAENDIVNDLMVKMGVSLQLSSSYTIVSGSGCTSTSSVVTTDQVTYGVSSLQVAASNLVTITSGKRLAGTSSQPVLAVSQPSGVTGSRAAYDVLLGGDINLFLSSCTGATSATANYQMWENLYAWGTCDDDSDTYFTSSYYCGGADCDDTSASISPGATETCNGVDDDCDGTVDDGVKTTYYRDADSDGYGTSGTSTTACSAPTGYVSNKTDCDDTSSAIKPGATETCNGVDDDCDGSADEGVKLTYYRDADSDGYGTTATTTTACSAPTGYVSDKTDCNDGSSTVHPGATETCNSVDDDCDGSTDEGVKLTYYRDADADSYGTSGTTTTGCSAPTGYVSDKTDCDDGASTVHPGATEACNSVDDDCDGSVDEGAGTKWYRDGDSDGYGTSATSTTACTAPTGYVASDTDCDDTTSAVSPGATESCNGVDDDCDGTVDDGVKLTWYADADADGHGAAASMASACTAPSGYVGNASDCDDTRSTVNPAADEYCNGMDDDCDGATDEADAVDAITYFADDDGDGYGEAAVTTTSCTLPTGYAANDDDCDDTSATTNPLAVESADGADNDCDGIVDEGTDWYDDDGDGYAEDGGDCDDGDALASPSGAESCDGTDQDCDGVTDDGTRCHDDDGDGLNEAEGDCNDADAAVSPSATDIPSNGIDDDCDGDVDGGSFDGDDDGYTAEAGGDCDDASAATFPGAPEDEDGVDNDCDGVTDEETAAYDDDGDGFSEVEGDCNDDDDGIAPDADDDPNGVDDDCDGDVDEGTDAFDDDGDGFTEEGGDCDDADPDVSPAADEVENGADDDCDGDADEGAGDWDQDGFSPEQGDCDDYDGWTSPAAGEACDGADNDCNGEIDEGCGGGGESEVEERKCGCDGTGGAVGLWGLATLALLGRRRRG